MTCSQFILPPSAAGVAVDLDLVQQDQVLGDQFFQLGQERPDAGFVVVDDDDDDDDGQVLAQGQQSAGVDEGGGPEPFDAAQDGRAGQAGFGGRGARSRCRGVGGAGCRFPR
jgi:hypothetical protein